MEDIPRKLLCSLIRQRGISIIQDPKNFPNFLTDYYKGEYKKERKCLTDSLLEDIPGTLLNKKNQLVYGTISQQLTQKLINNLGITPELAIWTVDTWAIALGVIRDEDLLPKDYVISINSTPHGAKVSLNGIFKGLTPLNLKNLEFDSYKVQISNDGYESWIQQFEVTSRNDQNIIANLTKKLELPKDYVISINSTPQGGKVFLDGILKGVTPLTLKNLKFNSYQAQIINDGYEPWKQSLDVVSRTDLNIIATLIKKPVQSEPIAIKTSRSFASSIAINLCIFCGIIGLILIILFLIGGTWPAVVTIESQGMDPHMNVGDLVFIVQKDRFGAMQTWVQGNTTGYKKFEDYGDVILYQPNGAKNPVVPIPFLSSGVHPIIHRAIDKADTADLPKYLLLDLENISKYYQPHGGYITKGDNNKNIDQVAVYQGLGVIEPVKDEWIIGKALFTIPLVGYLFLHFIEVVIFVVLIIILYGFFIRNRGKK